VSDRITFHGYEQFSDAAFRASDVFIYPNDYDPFAMVATEAMASGIAVVLGCDIGAAELVEHGRNGLLCNPRSHSSIHEQLARLAFDFPYAQAIGLAGRVAIERHTWRSCAEDTWSVYEQVLREKNTP
jgi:glycosyltransferase involved in cell wall biosynthesis